jgi:predicted membrane protein
MGRLIAGIVIIIIGLSALTGFSLFQFLFAILLIVIGVKVITGSKYHHNWKWNTATTSDEDSLNEIAIFSPLCKKVSSDNFKGGSVTMIFAGGEIDISNVKTDAKSVDLEITAVFGGGKLIIPKNWTLVSKSTAIFGGINNETKKGEGGIVLNLKGSAIFGGIEVIN